MSNVTVSVIVPIYNKEDYLKECLDSIVRQTLSSIEIILIDDGSTDKSKEICECYLSDERVSYYYQENEGLASARQAGINVAHGEYIGFIDADDWIEPTMYEKMYCKAKEYGADVVYCNKIYNDSGYKPSKEIPTGYYDREKILMEILPKSLAYINEKGEKRVISWNNCRRIYNRNLLEDISFSFDKRFRRSQDLQLTYETMLFAKGFYYMGDDRLYHTRLVGDSLSRGYTKNMWSLYIPLIERLYKDTENFKEADLMDQMHLRAFFFVTECIENEFKPLCPNDKVTRIEKISEIINHPICDRYYGHIELERLNPYYQKYYKLIHEKKAEEILDFTEKYKKKQAQKQKTRSKYIAPLLDILTENAVYKKLRGK